jgi:HK97 family phage portal protein
MNAHTRKEPELRAVQVTQSAPEFLAAFGITGSTTVSIEQALGVPAVWAAVNFLAGTIAGLPLHVYDKTANGKKRVKATKLNQSVSMLHDAVNDGLSSFDWRFQMMAEVLTEGRFVTYIERDARGQPINLYPDAGGDG